MHLSSTFLQSSLASWRQKRAFRQQRLNAAHAAGDAARIAKWQALLTAAAAMVARREHQLAALQPARRRTLMPGAEQRPRPSAGAFAPGFAPRTVLHTTEGSGDATSTLDSNRDHPHFEVLTNGHVIQYIPIDQAAKALRHPPGSIETNRASAIQIEVCGFANHTDWPAAQEQAVRSVLRFIEVNAGVARACKVAFVAGDAQRLDAAAWRGLTGICGHQHVPSNDHVDPGPIDAHALLV